MSQAYLERWSVAMRLVHWTLALAFLGLVASGLGLESPDLRGIPFLGSKLVREVHLSWAVLLFLVPAVAASWDGFRDIAGVWGEASHMAGADVRWLAVVCLRLPSRRAKFSSQGKLNPGQRLNVILLVVLIAGLAVSGVLLAPEAGRPVPQAIREVMYEVHRTLAYATLLLVVGHIVVATLWPTARPALRGMFLGSVRSDWAQDHHALWAADAKPVQQTASLPRLR